MYIRKKVNVVMKRNVYFEMCLFAWSENLKIGGRGELEVCQHVL